MVTIVIVMLVEVIRSGSSYNDIGILIIANQVIDNESDLE